MCLAEENQGSELIILLFVPRRKKRRRKEIGEFTCASMPIQDNVALLHDGVKNYAQEIVVLLMSTFPRLVAIHQLITIINEVAEHAIFLDGEADIHPLLALPHSESRTNAGEDLI